MDFNIEDIGTTKRKLSVEVPVGDVNSAFEQAINLLKKQTRLKGFRPGKAPIAMLKRLFGAQVEQDVMQKLIGENLPEAMKQVGETVVSSPTLEESKLTEGEPFRFTVSFDVKPMFAVSGYEGLKLTKEKIEITEEMVAQRIEDLRRALTTTRTLTEERPLQKGDIAIIDYQGFINDQLFEGGANPNYQLEVGSGRFHPDFEAALEGLAKGETKEVNVNFPAEHYNPKLAGKDVRFRVTLLDIKEKVLPEINDDLARDLNQELKTLDELKAKIREELRATAEERVKRSLDRQVRDRLFELVSFEVPASLVGQELEVMMETVRFNLKRSGLTMEAVGFKEDKLRQDYQPEAEKRVKVGLILERVAKDQNLTVTNEDIDEKMAAEAAATGRPLEVIKEFYRKSNAMDYLTSNCLTEKTLNFLYERATIEEVEASQPADQELVESDSDIDTGLDA